MVPKSIMPAIIAIAAIGTNRELGRTNELIWTIPDDLKRFREHTKGHPLIMGRKTFESIVAVRGSALPDRPNIVITRDADWQFEDVLRVASVKKALNCARTLATDKIYIGGGAQIYEEVLPFTNVLELTLIDAEAPDADTFFPNYESEFTKKLSEEKHEWNGLRYTWVTLERTD